jgi:hypothetical protein
LIAGFNDGRQRTLHSRTRIQSGRWTHVALTWGNGRLTLHIDGMDDVRTDYDGSPQWGRRDLVLGARWNRTDYGYEGDMDELCFYDRCLAPEELRGLRDRGLE